MDCSGRTVREYVIKTAIQQEMAAVDVYVQSNEFLLF